MTDSPTIVRTTQVISISLPPRFFQLLEKSREQYRQTRSAFIMSLIRRYSEEDRWSGIYKLGEKTKRRMKISSEDDIDRILHEE